MPKLTKRIVDVLMAQSATTDRFIWDSETKGFGVRKKPSGAASFLVQYRNKEGRTRRLAIGRVGVLTPDEARDLARDRLHEVAKGADPSAARHEIRKAITVAELCDLYLADAKSRIKATTLAMDRSRIARHVKPLIGKRRVTALTGKDVEKMQADIIAGKTATERKGRGGVTTGGKGVASRTVGMLGSIMEFGRKRGLMNENPARGIDRPADGRQRRYLTTAEMARLGEAMRAAEADGEGATGLAAIRFLLLSGCRRMEALALPIAWADRAGRCIRFQDTKSGAQVRAIGAKAFDVLDQSPHRGPWVFPATRGDGHFVGLPKVLERLCERAKLEGVTVHVLRHSFAATAAEMGYSELTIAGLLGHRVPGVTARYAHVPDAALASAADTVTARIAAALDGKSEGAEDHNVVPLVVRR